MCLAKVGFRAVVDCFRGFGRTLWFVDVVMFVWCLNGALNTGMYILIMWTARGAASGNTPFRVDISTRAEERSYNLTTPSITSLEVDAARDDFDDYFDLVPPDDAMARAFP